MIKLLRLDYGDVGLDTPCNILAQSDNYPTNTL